MHNRKNEISSAPNRSRTYDLPISPSDALQETRGSEAIKLGSCVTNISHTTRIEMSL